MKTQTKSCLNKFRISSAASLCQRSLRTIGGLVVLLAGMHLSGPVEAAQIVWTNTAGGNWNAATNWSPNQVPGSADDAVITASGTYAVTLNTSSTVNSLALGGASGQQTLANNGYSLTLNQASVINPNGVFTLNGTAAGTGSLTVQGQFIWNGGYISPGSVLTVATNGLLAVAGGNGHALYGVITNAGTIQLLNGGGDLWLYGSCEAPGSIGELINLPGALVDVQGDNSITWGCGTELVVNQGVVRKSGGTGTTYIYPSLTNSGTLDVQTGTVSLYYGQGSGVFLPEAGATLIFSRTYEVDNALTGMGTNLLNGGTFTLNGNINGSNVVLNGAYLLASNTVVNGALTWNNGNINAGSVLTVATNGLLALASGNEHNFYGIMTNAGTIQLLNGGGDLYLYGNCNPGAIGELVNLPGALVDVQGDNSINYNCNTTELVVNQGVLRKSGGTGATTIRLTFTNSGTLDVQTGTVNLNKGQGSGLFLPEAGATLIFNQTYEVDSALTGAGTNLLNGGTFTLNGNINGSNVVLNGANLLASNTVINGALTWNSGNINAGSVLTVATNGLLALASGNGHALYGIVTNAGTIQLLNGGSSLSLYGSCAGGIGELINLPGALVDVQGDNSISYGCGTEQVLNQGVLRKSGGTGTTTIYPIFNNSGTLDVQTGTVNLNKGQGSGLFLPEAGATLIFNQTYEVDNALTGAGTNLLNGGTFTLNGNINGSNVVLNGAYLLASNTVINSALTWNNGNINAGSVLTVATNRLLVLASGSGHSLYGIVTNAGTIQLLNGGGNLYLYGSCKGGGAIGELVNLPGALVDVQGDSVINDGCGTELVVNQGVVRKSGGTGTTTIQPQFYNSGTLDVQTGTVNLNNTGQGSGLFLPEAGATLIFSATYEVDNALTGAGTNLLNGGTFTLNGNINGSNVVMNGANLLASNTVVNGTLTWNNGNINAGSVLTVATNRLLVLASGGGHYLYGTMTNAGTIQLLNGGGNLYLYGSCRGGGAIGELVNLPRALVDVQGDNSITYGCGTELLLNQGVLRKSGGTGTTIISPIFTNSGTLDVQTGTVSLNSTGQGSGVFLPEAGATLIFNQTYEVDNALTGAGTNLLNGGTFTLNGNINGSNVVLNGASLLASNTVINSTLTWNYGNIIAGSVVTVATNRLLVLASGYGHALFGIVTNAGTIQLLNGGGNLNLYGSCNPGAIGELVNLPGALVDVQGDNSIAWQCGTELVVNQGVLRKSGGTNTTTIVPTFANSGTVQANSGTVSFGNAFIQNAGQTVLNGGNYTFSQVAQLLGGALIGIGTITGSVSNDAAIGTGASPGLLAISGNYTEGPNAVLAIKLGGTSVGTTYDQLSIGGNASLAGSLNVSYWNGFTPAAGNVFTVLACSVRTGAFSAVTSPNSGLDAVYTATNVLVLPHNAPPTARLTVPAQALAGHTFTVSGSGTYLQGTVTNFALLLGTNILLSVPGSSATVSYSSDFPGNLTFTAVATGNDGAQGQTNATMTNITLPLLTLDAIGFQTNRAFKLLMLGVAGTNYQVLASTNLAVTNWTPLGTMQCTNGIWRYFDTTVTNSPQRFYRAKQLSY
jgi:hypothetical protein